MSLTEKGEGYVLPQPAAAKPAPTPSRASKLAARARKTATLGLVLLGTYCLYSAHRGEASRSVHQLMHGVPPSWAEFDSTSTWEDSDSRSAWLDPASHRDPATDSEYKSLLESVTDTARSHSNPALPNKLWASVHGSLGRVFSADECDLARVHADRPVVTFLNTHLDPRRLNDRDHLLLVDELQALEAAGEIEFADVQMGTGRREDRFCQALRSDIMLGLHGDALASAFWMKPGSGVIEIQLPSTLEGENDTEYFHMASLLNHEYAAIPSEAEDAVSAGWYTEDGQRLGPEGAVEFDAESISVDVPTVAVVLRRMVDDWKARSDSV